MARRRIWSELVPLDVLAETPALEALAARRVQLLFAVQPGQEEGARRVVARCASQGLSVGLWPLLDDADGRWLHPGNAERFEAWVRTLLDAVEGPIDALALDLEGALGGHGGHGLGNTVGRRVLQHPHGGLQALAQPRCPVLDLSGIEHVDAVWERGVDPRGHVGEVDRPGERQLGELGGRTEAQRKGVAEAHLRVGAEPFRVRDRQIGLPQGSFPDPAEVDRADVPELPGLGEPNPGAH